MTKIKCPNCGHKIKTSDIMSEYGKRSWLTRKGKQDMAAVARARWGVDVIKRERKGKK